jgi:hypothetical protein
MDDYIARKRLKQKVLERWENEGGKIETNPTVPLSSTRTREDDSAGSRSSRPLENSQVRTLNLRTGKARVGSEGSCVLEP